MPMFPEMTDRIWFCFVLTGIPFGIVAGLVVFCWFLHMLKAYDITERAWLTVAASLWFAGCVCAPFFHVFAGEVARTNSWLGLGLGVSFCSWVLAAAWSVPVVAGIRVWSADASRNS